MGVQAPAQKGARTQEYVDISSSGNEAEWDEWTARCSSYFVNVPKPYSGERHLVKKEVCLMRDADIAKIDEFLKTLLHLSENTHLAYGRDLRVFLDHCNAQGIEKKS